MALKFRVRRQRHHRLNGPPGVRAAVWRLDMRHKFSLAFVAALAVFPLGSAIAQVGESGYSLPLALAVKAATKAIATCASNGHPVSAVVVDPSGVIKLEAKGDHSTVHTATSAFRKASTVVTFGPIFRFDASSVFAALCCIRG
jgi:Haem-degrading